MSKGAQRAINVLAPEDKEEDKESPIGDLKWLSDIIKELHAFSCSEALSSLQAWVPCSEYRSLGTALVVQCKGYGFDP